MSLVLLMAVLCYVGSSSSPFEVQDDRSCFCEISGQIEDCICSAETLESMNKKIHPTLQALVKTDAFKYYKVNLNRGCRFWKRDGLCTSPKCHVEVCEHSELPSGIFHDHLGRLLNCEDDKSHDLSYNVEFNGTISEDDRGFLERWKAFDAENGFCEVGDTEVSEDTRFVNLLDNPERYTGYSGESAHKIWNSIYKENCFETESATRPLSNKELQGMCIEKRAFYRAISGLHASINMHVSAIFPTVRTFPVEETIWGLSVEKFKHYFSPETTNGQGTEWLRNLFFIYSLYKQAVAKAAPLLESSELSTGNAEKDQAARSLMKKLLTHIKSSPVTFDETQLFNGPPEEVSRLKDMVRTRFRNITLIMDCVACDKCRLWGKLQTQGLGTALKLLLSGSETPGIEPSAILRRNELVALFNGFARLSHSLFNLSKFREILHEEALHGEPSFLSKSEL